ncbi:hypothetical protein DL96DRAFT_1631257 [Flagelloscypha sp. PMI_526]|nr:hypothetical protein DL96DRAFT_1631257 [Flagelloscypha sp. PMI_526]
MIISPEKFSLTATPPPVPPKDILPPYSVESGPSSSGSGVHSRRADFPLPENVQPCNLLHFSTGKYSMEHKFIVDPNLSIPPSLLPPLREGETDAMRANLSLHSKHSHICSEAWIVPGPSHPTHPPSSEVVRITAKASHHISLLLHNDAHTIPLRISCKSSHSRIKVFLPKTFVGTVNASTKHGKVHFSPAILAKGTLLGNIDKTKRIFVGDLSLYEEGGLDEAELVAPHANVSVFLEDEWSDLDSATPGSVIKGSMKKLFGTGTLREELRESVDGVQYAPLVEMDAKVPRHPRVQQSGTTSPKARVLVKKRVGR